MIGSSTLVVSATEAEARHLPSGTRLLVTGIGKVRASMALTRALATAGDQPIERVVNIGTAGALGDAGSPASDSTLGPTAGLGADGQHDHIRDSVIPTFIHFNIPLLIAGWAGALIL